jgi:PKD repeat protein
LRRQDGEARLHLTWTDAASVCQAPAAAAFDVFPLTGTAPLTVTYRNQSSGDYTNCTWEYGDGTTAETCADEHQYTYADPGTYKVRLSVAGPGGLDTSERSQWIAVHAPEPAAALDAWPPSGEVPLRVSFANLSSGSFSACAWDYGDGHSSTSCDVDHVYTYTVGGTYSVSLAVTGPGGSDKITHTALIHAGGPRPPCEPDADSVAVYADAGYGGPCTVLQVGEYADAAGMAPLSDNDAEAVRAGANVQALLYEHPGFQGRSEVVAGYRSDLQDGALGANALSSLKVQPVDVEKPSLTWSAPVSDTGIHRTVAGLLQLQADAHDNLGIAKVRFLRWDHPKQQLIAIGTDEATPYRVALDSSDLALGWNQVFAQALDLAQNGSDLQYIWVYRDLPRPDLRPFALPGHPYPVVPASMAGTYTTSVLHLAGPTYVDWRLANDGEVDVAEPFLVELELDGAQIAEQTVASLAPGTTGGTDDWAHTFSEPGWHSLRLIVDPDDRIAESDEENNVWEGAFYWAPSAPYADDMENGPDGWAPSGLWHPVSADSPHPASHSGDHSWWYGQDASGSYDVGQVPSGTLTSGPIYIPTTGYHLRFWYWYQTETAGPGWDQRWVLASIDGRPFSPIYQLRDDPQGGWLQSPAIDLSGYAGHVTQFRFAFDAVDELENDYRGWYIDDVTIASEPLPSCQDDHEPNDWVGLATPISYGQSVQGDICPGGDFDLYTFDGKAGDEILIDVDAKSIGSLLDPYLFVLSHDGLTVLAENDDEVTEEVQDSLLQYRLPYDATYIVKVRAWDHPSVGSADHYYTLRLSYTGSDGAGLDRRFYLPLAVR